MDCLNMNSMPPISLDGNCMNCVMKEFTGRRIYYSPTANYEPLEIVNIDSCPWYLLMEERDIALSKNDSLRETISDAIHEIDILRQIMIKNSNDYSI